MISKCKKLKVLDFKKVKQQVRPLACAWTALCACDRCSAEALDGSIVLVADGALVH